VISAPGLSSLSGNSFADECDMIEWDVQENMNALPFGTSGIRT
jgi:hypothetical protein